METHMKKCTTCLQVKPLQEFRNQSSTKDKKKYSCVQCDSEVQAKRYQLKKEQIKKQTAEWQSKNLDKKRIYNQRSRARRKKFTELY
jgi:hypothetical protein